MNKLTSPLVIVLLGLILGVGTSLAFFWQASVPLIAASKALKAKQAKSHESVKPEAPWDFWTIEIEELANELRDMKAVVRKKEEEVLAREQRFAAEKAELNKQRQQIEALRDEIARKIIEVQGDEAKSLKSLANTYSAMTPKALIPILREMDDTTVVKIFSLMKTEVVSAIFEEFGRQAATDTVLARRVAVISDKFRLLKTKAAGTP
ncbi:MotE family protein [Nibricoccus sp. IMCC34717]|uniref:MotE family protein n=1 Tax=Nibricoccus sp. IMCC34717 TaxID=3034021 RepID=UPI00384CC312